MTNPSPKRDGFEVIEHGEAGKVIHFVACDYTGSMREKVEAGLVRKTDLDRFFVRDTREAKPARKAAR